ncbi:NAD-dependent succinate-semialdehyde dehydrogenase [Aliikangiella sp. IMCC44359]|uniref:NAD-dependent succinate-semialdehyde dehydrogenase n=1 Tax=Aliikangiella sp. IMCC44359 TaxID=3459125 RepID=UPI00403AA88E
MQLNNPELLKNASFINGQWLTSETVFEVENPANGQIVGTVSEVTPGQLEMAVNSAYAACEVWQSKTVDERAVILKSWNDLIRDNQQDLAQIMTAEQGKPIHEAIGEVAYGASYIEWYAEEGRRIKGSVLPNNQQGRRALVQQTPVGVVSAITPWNFPGAMLLRKASAALAAGCTFIVKPSELTPFSALALAELSLQAGIPPGVFNVVIGSNAQPIGEVLTLHPKVAKFSFTGSTAVGKKLLSQCASTVKKTSMELGGNAPFIIFEDADIDKALDGLMRSKFRNAGQTCVSANRIFVHQSLHDELVERLRLMVSELTIGDGQDETTQIGPLINLKAVEKVEKLVAQAVTSGAKLVLGGEKIKNSGYFYQPTILTGVKPFMDIFNQEIFAPVASIIAFEQEDQVIQLANQTNYGLCSYAYTNNANRIWRLSEKLAFGMVGINEGVLSNALAPFGGIKESGMGREGGHWGIEEYLETRYVCIGNVE